MARSAQSAAMGGLPGYVPQAPTVMPAFQAPQVPQVPVPPMPAGAVVNPANQPREKLLTSMLDPSSTAYLGNKYRGGLQSATGNLAQGLAGFGGYQVTETASGAADIKRNATSQPGERYQQEMEAQRAAANARGMLFSSFADEAVGAAWQRLGEQEREVLNAYSSSVSSIMLAQDADFSAALGELNGLYGQDIQYALENPPPPAPAPAPPAAASPAGGAPGVASGGGGSTWTTMPAPTTWTTNPDRALTPGGYRAPGGNNGVIALGDEVSPHQASLLAQQGYKIGRPGSGRYKGQLVAVKR